MCIIDVDDRRDMYASIYIRWIEVSKEKEKENERIGSFFLFHSFVRSSYDIDMHKPKTNHLYDTSTSRLFSFAYY
jgi:Mg2+ and Co2+ transporter CorA